MADEKIQVEIGGKYTAKEQFKQWDSDVKKMQAEHKDMSKSAVSALRNIAGTFDGELNAAVSHSISLLTEMTRGGIWGAMGAAASIGLEMAIKGMQALVEKIGESNDRILELLEHCNDFRDSLNKIADSGAIKRMNESLKAATKDAKEAMEAIESAAAAVNSLEGAKGASAAAAAQESIAKIVRDKAIAVAASMNSFDRAVIEAKADLEVATLEMAEAERSAAAAVEAANRQYQTAQDKQLQAIDNLVAAQRAVEVAEGEYKKAKIHGAISEKDYEQKLESARAAEKAALVAKTKVDNDVAVALEKQSEAESRKAAAVARAEAKVVQLTASRDEAIRKMDESTDAEAGLMAATKNLSDAYNDEASERKALASELQNQKETMQEATQTQIKGLEGKIRSAEKEIEGVNALRKSLDEGERAYLKHHNWMGRALSRNADGGIDNFGDFLKAQRWKARADRDKNSLFNQSQDAKYNDIMDRIASGKKVSDRDRKFAEDWGNFKKQRDGTDSLEKDIRNWKEKQIDISEKTRDAVEKIEKDIKQALGVR